MIELSGTGVAIVTPFNKNKEVDYKSLGKLIDYIIEGGVQYIVTLGTTGETPVLSKEEKIDIITFTFEHINNRVPVMVGMAGNDTATLINDLQKYPIQKAAAILSAAPFYNKPSQEGLFQHYKLVAECTEKPIVLYNVPARTGRNINVSTILRLANEVENIVGIKEASGDMLQCMEILKNRPADFLVVSGDDALALPQMACGMNGVISVAANAFPAEFSTMIKHCLQQDYFSAKLMNDKLMQAYQIMFEENNPAGVKAFLSEMNIIQNELRLPLVPLSEHLHKQVKVFLTNYNKN